MECVLYKTGESVGLLTVVEEAGRKHGSRLYFCQCKCGGSKKVIGEYLRTSPLPNCGCAGRKQKRAGLVGRKFGKLYAEKYSGAKKDRDQAVHMYECRCDCGGKKVARADYLKRSKLPNCGCVKRRKPSGRGKGSIGPSKSLAGQTFGSLEVLELVGPTPGPAYDFVWKCRCVCGEICEATGNSMKTGNKTCCGCLRYKKLKATLQKSGRRCGVESNFYQLFKKIKYQAGKRNLEFLLSEEEVRELTSKDCFYCGVEPLAECTYSNDREPYLHNGIDRVSSGKGYTAENCVPCCKDCNLAKNTMTHEQFYAWAQRLAKHIVNKTLD